MNLLHAQRAQQTNSSEAAAPSRIRNFLFLIPENAPELERTVVVNAARRMTEHGYVYLAEGGRKDVEDHNNVRHMPLNSEYLPAFGLTTTVVVLRREDLAQMALQAYPDAQVFLLAPSVAAAAEAETQEVAVDHYFSCLRPWLVTGQMAAVRH